jgi:hypothetical protein
MAGALLVNQNGFVGPMPGVTNVDANSIVIHVAGTGGQSGPGNQPRSAAIEQNATITAYIVAPNGMINFRQNVNATGAFIAKWVLAEQNAKVTRPGDPVVRAADVESGTAETAIITAPGITTTVETTTVVHTEIDVTRNALFLPLVTVDAVAASETVDSETVDSETVDSETVDSETVDSETVAVEMAPVLTATLPLTTTAPVTTTVITTTVPVTPTNGEPASAPTPTTIYLPVVANEGS